jgi:ABC-type sugar transport system ATPase subunit
MSSITLDGLGKTYADGSVAVRRVDLTVADGEIVVLVGPSGCGKSTILRLIAGLEVPTAGRVLIDGGDVTGLPPQRRDLAMVFQSYALYPHLDVRGNLSFGLRVRGGAPARVAQRVEDVASMLGLGGLLERKPAELSGGQRQRVALGRAIVREPRAFLLDEPLSNLDPRLRVETRTELALLLRRLRATMVYVTHDQEEAMTLGHRIAVMRDGAIAQVGPPLDVFHRPADTFVAGFVGSPAMNLIPGVLGAQGGEAVVRCGPLEVRAAGVSPHPGARDVIVGIRPHDVGLAGDGGGDLGGRVEVLEALGGSTLLHVRADLAARPLLRVLAPPDAGVRVDERVALRVRPDRLHVFDSRSGERMDAGDDSTSPA